MGADASSVRRDAVTRALAGIRKRPPRGELRRDLRQDTAYLTREPRRREREERLP